MTRSYNRIDWLRPGWVLEMIEAIGDAAHFRWFDSGDCYHPDLAGKIHLVVKGTPGTRHWMPTRSYKIPRIKKVLDKMMRECDNIVVRYSSDSVDGTFTTKGKHRSTIVHKDDAHLLPKGVHICPAYTQGGKCGSCRACWQRGVQKVAYIAHTQKMEKVIHEG